MMLHKHGMVKNHRIKSVGEGHKVMGINFVGQRILEGLKKKCIIALLKATTLKCFNGVKMH